MIKKKSDSIAKNLNSSQIDPTNNQKSVIFRKNSNASINDKEDNYDKSIEQDDEEKQSFTFNTDQDEDENIKKNQNNIQNLKRKVQFFKQQFQQQQQQQQGRSFQQEFTFSADPNTEELDDLKVSKNQKLQNYAITPQQKERKGDKYKQNKQKYNMEEISNDNSKIQSGDISSILKSDNRLIKDDRQKINFSNQIQLSPNMATENVLLNEEEDLKAFKRNNSTYNKQKFPINTRYLSNLVNNDQQLLENNNRNKKQNNIIASSPLKTQGYNTMITQKTEARTENMLIDSPINKRFQQLVYQKQPSLNNLEDLIQLQTQEQSPIQSQQTNKIKIPTFINNVFEQDDLNEEIFCQQLDSSPVSCQQTSRKMLSSPQPQHKSSINLDQNKKILEKKLQIQLEKKQNDSLKDIKRNINFEDDNNINNEKYNNEGPNFYQDQEHISISFKKSESISSIKSFSSEKNKLLNLYQQQIIFGTTNIIDIYIDSQHVLYKPEQKTTKFIKRIADSSLIDSELSLEKMKQLNLEGNFNLFNQKATDNLLKLISDTDENFNREKFIHTDLYKIFFKLLLRIRKQAQSALIIQFVLFLFYIIFLILKIEEIISALNKEQKQIQFNENKENYNSSTVNAIFSIICGLISAIIFGFSFYFLYITFFKCRRLYLNKYYAFSLAIFTAFNIASFVLSFNIQLAFLNGILLFVFGASSVIILPILLNNLEEYFTKFLVITNQVESTEITSEKVVETDISS